MEPQQCSKKDESDWRLMVININNFPTEYNGQEKAKFDILKQEITSSGADIIGLTELGRNENNLPNHSKPSNIVKKWLENGVASSAWNQRDTRSAFEPGGVMTITRDKSTAHTIKRGKDLKNLGRWAWVTVKGKQNRKTTVITTYRATNLQATAQNQLGSIRQVNVSIQPEEMWENDLARLIQEKKSIGAVIVMGDFNCNLNDSESKVSKYFRQMEMREIINEKYGKGPATYQFGRHTIDGIYATQGISIRQGGYGGVTVTPGDHLCPWVDIEEQDIVGIARDDRPPPILRKATSKIPTVRMAFDKVLNEEVSKYKLHEKAEKLIVKARTDKRLSEEDAANYEKIEECLLRAVKCADRRCRKARTGKTPFSKKQKELMGRIYVLKVIRQRQKLVGRAGRPRSRKLQRMKKKYKYAGPSHFDSLQQIDEEIEAASMAYSKFRPKAHEFRQTYIGNLADEIAWDKGRDPEVVFRELTHREQIKEHFKNIKRREKRGERYGVDRVDVETDEGLKTLVNKEEIEEEILKVNKEKLLQARDTPLRVEPLRSIIGERMEYEKWEKLLKKEINIPDRLEEGTRLWFEAIQDFSDDPFEIEWTTEEYFDGWKAMSEDKSSLPGIQAAHLKSVDPSSKAADTISWMALIPLITGYVPLHWKRGVDSMIPKKKNEWRAGKLRLILLMEARFNHNNKLIGKKMMEYGERKGFLAREQFGSRKSKSAIEHALNKRITIDIARQAKTPAVYIANDAKSCYDRILLMVAYLTMRHMGVPKLAAISSIDTLVNMPRAIKTVYGKSEGMYATDKLLDEILHGIGQGNGYGPIIWAGISSPLLKILRKRKHGVHLLSPITREELEMAGYSFVDDTDQIELRDGETVWENVLANAQSSLELWECLLRTTGGAIEPTKTDWVKVLYEWKNGTPRLQKANQNDEIWAKNPEGINEKIKQIEPNEARRTLGVWQAADGQEDTQKEVLINKIKDWGANTDGISKKEAKTATVSTLGRSIRYPLAATAMTTQQCEEVDKHFRKHVLGKLGVVRTAPGTPIYSPVELGGIGLQRTEVNQTIDHIKMIIQHGHTDSITGKLIRNTLEQLSIEAGLGTGPLLVDLTKVNYLTERTWIENTIRSCQKYNISIESSVKGIPNWTDRDEYIMDRAIQQLKGQELKIFNKVRLFLQVATTSDIANADGKSIDREILRGKRSTSPSPSTQAYKWPNMPTPTRTEERLWGESLCRIYSNTAADPSLDYNNYRWFHTDCVKIVTWNYDVSDNKVYQKTGDVWIRWDPRRRSERRTRSNSIFEKTNTMINQAEPSTQWRPITIEKKGEHKLVIKSQGRYHVKVDEAKLLGTWYSPRKSQIGYEEEQIFMDQVKLHKGLIVGDGSYKAGRSSAAIVVQHQRTNNIDDAKKNTQTVTVPGHAKEQSSYRGELGGILAGVVFANKVCEDNNITEGKCTMGCDNMGALSASFGWRTPNPNWVCFDLVGMIRYHIRKSPIQWESQHIKGHQDDAKNFKELTLEAQANVIADKKAKEELKDDNIPMATQYVPGQPWMVICDGQKVTGNVEQRLRLLMQQEESKRWWMKKLRIDDHYVDRIAWDVYEGYRTSTPKWKNNWSVKFGAGILPTQNNLVLRGHGQNTECPCCGGETEDTDHLFQCPGEEMTKTYEDERDKIFDFLSATTSFTTRDHILDLLDSLRFGRELELDGDTPSAKAAFHQARMGQRATLNGMWLSSWKEIQDSYLKRLKSKKSSKVWMIRFTLMIQNMIHTMWKTRNDAIHNKEDSTMNKEKHEDLDRDIDNIFRDLPPTGSMPTCDAAFFKRGADKIKRYRLRRKELWVADATRIQEAFFYNLTPTSEAFLNYFETPART
jgi:hypothetical protein